MAKCDWLEQLLVLILRPQDQGKFPDYGQILTEALQQTHNQKHPKKFQCTLFI